MRVSYSLTIPARLTFTIEKKLTGRLIKGRCIPVTHANRARRPCTRLLPVHGSLTRASAAGSRGFTFTGRIGGRPIKPGSYLFTVILSANRRFGNAQNITFQILP